MLHLAYWPFFAKFIMNINFLILFPGKASAATAKFATSSEYIKACFNPQLAPKLAAASASLGNTSKNLLPDYSKYLKRLEN